jgi:peptidyl-prolyl cis-trans isomerase SurA
MGRLRILGLALLPLLGLAELGCVSEKSRTLGEYLGTNAAELGESETPRVSRLQSGPGPAPAPAGAPAVGPGLNRELRIKVRAWVNGQPIFDDDIYQTIIPDIAQLLRQHLTQAEFAKRQAEIYKIVLDQFIDRELLYQEAIRKLSQANNDKMIKKLNEIAKLEFTKKIRLIEERGNISHEAFLDILHKQGTTLESMERLERTKFFATEFLRSLILPKIEHIGRTDALEYYESHLNMFYREDSVHWQDLFIAIGPKHPSREQAHAFAEQLAQRLKQREDIKNLLQFDDGRSHYNNGDGTGKKRGQIEPAELEKFLFNLADGEVGPIVELSTGFHVFRLIRREYAGQMPFDQETQKIIITKLKNEIADRETKRIIDDLKRRAVIEIERD